MQEERPLKSFAPLPARDRTGDTGARARDFSRARGWRGSLTALGCSLAIGLLSACSAPAPLPYPECKNDAACSAHGQICAAGFCRQCRSDEQCKAGEQCVAGGCAPKPECASDAACAPGLLCKSGKCAPECSPESAAADCGPASRCIANRCAAADQCSTDDDCGSGKACVDSRCRSQVGITTAAPAAPISCNAGPIYFEYDDSALDASARAAAADAWQCLQREGFRRLLITGHTDERGTTEYNLALGGRRAEDVRKYLIGLGAPGRKLRCVSFGKERPLDPGHGEKSWAANRRVEINLEK